MAIDMEQYEEISLDEAKKVMFNMLIEFDKICKKNNLTYWLTGGTMLGAIRHKGFIPWDDDIDLSMPRDDYERLRTIELPSNWFLQNKKTDSNFKQYWTKIRLDDSLYIENQELGRDIKYHQGIFLDIFPINFIDTKIFFLYPKIQHLIGGVLSNRRFYSKFLQRDLKLDAIRLLNLFHSKNNDVLIESLDTLDNNLKDVKKNDVFPLTQREFAGGYFPTPNNSHNFLTRFYGSTYMELPPEKERAIHNYKIYLKRQ